MSNKISSVQVLGSGCPSCHKLLDLSKQALSDLDIDVSVEYITEIDQIIASGIMSTPALTINNKPVLSGRVPSLEEIKKIILENN
jgi:small redox-active disulfide protein 2